MAIIATISGALSVAAATQQVAKTLEANLPDGVALEICNDVEDVGLKFTREFVGKAWSKTPPMGVHGERLDDATYSSQVFGWSEHWSTKGLGVGGFALFAVQKKRQRVGDLLVGWYWIAKAAMANPVFLPSQVRSAGPFIVALLRPPRELTKMSSSALWWRYCHPYGRITRGQPAKGNPKFKGDLDRLDRSLKGTNLSLKGSVGLIAGKKTARCRWILHPQR